MANGKWQISNGKWQMANGKWQMVNGKWQLANFKWQMVSGKCELFYLTSTYSYTNNYGLINGRNRIPFCIDKTSYNIFFKFPWLGSEPVLFLFVFSFVFSHLNA
jgi:hypothetical protein